MSIKQIVTGRRHPDMTSLLSLNQGKPVSTSEVAEMKRRRSDGQSINYIAMAMCRSWTSVNRYVHGLSWIETRNPTRSPEDHLAHFRLISRRRVQLMKLHKVFSECVDFL
jgi:hypothetical protein